MGILRRLTTLVVATVIALLAGAPVAAIETLSSPASDLRITLDRLLSEHAYLTVQAMHAGVTDEAQFEAAADALESNSAELQGALAGLYGDAAGEQFGELWRAHVGHVVDYTLAHEAGDAAAQQAALDGLAAYQEEFAAFLAGANPSLSEEELGHLLENHLVQLEQVANLQSGDYNLVYAAAREAYGHMFDLGDGLAVAIVDQFPDRFPGRDLAFGPAVDLRIALDRLLGEHAFLAVEVMRLSASSEEATEAASAALASNGDALAEAIAGIYGEEAGRDFTALWAQHNGHYVDYVRALVDDDAPGEEAAREGLEEFGNLTADFFSGANEALDPETVRAGIAHHTDQLVAQVEAHQAGDYLEAFSTGREAYQHMGAVSDLLATGIANQFPERFLPNTATERSATPVGTAIPVGWLVLGVLAALGGGAVLRRRLAG